MRCSFLVILAFLFCFTLDVSQNCVILVFLLVSFSNVLSSLSKFYCILFHSVFCSACVFVSSLTTIVLFGKIFESWKSNYGTKWRNNRCICASEVGYSNLSCKVGQGAGRVEWRRGERWAFDRGDAQRSFTPHARAGPAGHVALHFKRASLLSDLNGRLSASRSIVVLLSLSLWLDTYYCSGIRSYFMKYLYVMQVTSEQL